MAKSKRKRVPKTVLKLPDLEQSKSAVLPGRSMFRSAGSSTSTRSSRHIAAWRRTKPVARLWF